MAEEDPLREYRRKRDFGHTTEPAGVASVVYEPPEAAPATGDDAAVAGQGSFVVQKHSARTLHYDFRLELGGVLLSWAVPKGPSLDPSVKRLAVQTEDHPLEYGSFEGMIPKGHYGAGTVVIWDRGTWLPSGDAVEQYRAGHMEFTLYGERLRGRWHLVRRGEAKRWLLFKSRDAEARPAAQGAVTLNSVTHPRARQRSLPDIVSPQLATLVKTAPDEDTWLHEVKFDGYRMQLRVEHGTARALTRNGNDWSERMPRLVDAAAHLPVESALLDGEVCVLRADGRSDFQALQNSFKAGSDDSLVYFAFDLLFLNGWDLRQVPLVERKMLLMPLVRDNVRGLRYSDHVLGSGQRFFIEACRQHLEGIICKRTDAAYVSKRTQDWLKVKCSKRQELVIGGYTAPAGSRRHFGALLLGAYDGAGRLVYRGKVGSGFTADSLRSIHAQLKTLQRPKSPFESSPSKALARQATWVAPVLLAEVEFAELTSEGILRHSTFKGLREDKSAHEVIMEEPPPISESVNQEGTPEAPGAAADPPGAADAPDRNQSQVRLTSPDRVIYPEQGITKRDLANYYVKVAEVMLPHVANRILTLVRCPQGQSKECFYQKHLSTGMPEAIATVPVVEKTKSVHYMVIRDAVGLLSLVQFGVLEIHVWGAHADRPDRPDQLVFDLDPDPEVAWSEVVAGARTVRHRLSELGLESFAKTTGGKGLHVVVPIERRVEWDAAKAFCRAVALDITAREPSKYVATMSKARRRGRIFIDYFRNGRGATSVCAYSTRARPTALVATPLSWHEVIPEVRPEHFTITTVPERLAKQGDQAWEGYFRTRQSITKAMCSDLGIKH